MALFKEERTINPESQNTGIDTIYPVMLMASGEFFSPTLLRMLPARTFAPPLRSRYSPMIAPAAITMPMLCSVEPKPPAIELMSDDGFKPDRNPMAMAPKSRARNGWRFNRAVIQMMTATTSNSHRNMIIIPLFSRFLPVYKPD